MPSLTLTDDAIADALRALDRPELELWDDLERGLFVRLRAATDKHAKGSAAFRFRYRFASATKNLTIGGWPAWSVDEARSEVKNHLRRELKKGNDPGAGQERRRAAAGPSLADAARKWIDKMTVKWSPKTTAEVRRIFGIPAPAALVAPGSMPAPTPDKAVVYIPPHFAKRLLADIDRPDIVALLDKIEKRNGPVMANRVLAWLRALFRYYLSQGKYVKLDPTAGLKMNHEKSKERDLTDDELRRVWAAAGRLPAAVAAYLRLLVLTGQRRSEVAGIRASQIDRSNRLWTMPAAHYKTGVANVVPLSDAAWLIVSDLLSDADAAGADHLLRSGTADVPLQGFTKIKAAIDKAVTADGGGALQPWGFHDLRRTLRGGLSRLGIPGEVAERCLGHVVGGMEGVYNKYDFLTEKKRAFDIWAAHVAGLGKPPTANVRDLEAERARRGAAVGA